MKVGLIAGSGRFPLIFARAARRNGHQVILIALKGETMEALARETDHCYWVEIGQFQTILDHLKTEKIDGVVMAGKIQKTVMFSPELKLDDRTRTLLDTLKNNNDGSILRAFVDELEQEGIPVLDSVTFISDLLPRPGPLTSGVPSPVQMADVEYGWHRARRIAGLDIGQTIVVKNRAVMAVEAIEGTDETIRRGGRLGNEGVVVIKVARPIQDRRFDMPVVGLDTIRTLVEVGARVLVVEAGCTIILDQEQAIALAERHDICIYAFTENAG